MRPKLHSSPIIVVDKSAIKRAKLVYLFIADKLQKYPWGKSRIVYIGQTKKGVARVSGSAAHRAKRVFENYGVRKFFALAVTCQSRHGVSMWKVLERDLLCCFKKSYGDVPKLNSSGRKLNPNDLSEYFRERYLQCILRNAGR